MYRVDNYAIWIGNARDASNLAQLNDSDIKTVVHLAIEESQPSLPREFSLLRIPLHDDASNAESDLRLAVNVIVAMVRQQIPSIVCCSAGMSRSPATTACALALIEHTSPVKVLARIHECHPTDVSPGLWNQLQSLASTQSDQ